MMTRHLLHLDANGLTAYAWRAGRLRVEGCYPADATGLRHFADDLARHTRRKFWLLANLAEEAYATASIPFLRGQDRQVLIQRKLDQHCGGASFATAFSLGYEKTRRKDEKLLLAALTNAAHFEPWLACINQAGSCLAGIYTLAQLAGALLSKLGHVEPRCLLLSLHEGTIRESYVVDGRTHFSRLVQLTERSSDGIAKALLAESAKLQQYVSGVLQPEADALLPAYLLAPPHTLTALGQVCHQQGLDHYTLLDASAIAKQLGLQGEDQDCICTQIFLHRLASAPPRQQFAGAAHRLPHQLLQLRRMLSAISLAALLGGPLFALAALYQAQQLHDEISAEQHASAELQRRHQELAAHLPQPGVDHTTLRQVAQRHAELIAEQRQPADSYLPLSQALDQYPAIRLDNLTWKNSQNPASTAASQVAQGATTTVRGTIHLDGAPPRQILAVFEQFVAALAARPDLTVKVLQRPIAVESGAPLRGGDTPEHAAKPNTFSLDVTRSDGS